MASQRRTILVAVDFEGASTRAVQAAKWIASGLDGELVLLHVYDRPSFAHPELSDEIVERIEKLTEQERVEALAKLGAESGDVRTLFRHGDPALRIVEAAAELRPAMLVMGTHGRGGLGRLLMGSIAAQVMRASPVPVVTVRALAEEVA